MSLKKEIFWTTLTKPWDVQFGLNTDGVEHLYFFHFKRYVQAPPNSVNPRNIRLNLYLAICKYQPWHGFQSDQNHKFRRFIKLFGWYWTAWKGQT